MERPFSRMRSYLFLLLAILVLGTLSVMVTEGLSPINAFYFVVVTIATVGYGDIVPQSIYGKIIAVLLIIAGVGTFIAIFTEIFWLRDKIREIPLLFFRDHVILCGINETTETLVHQFRGENTRSVVISGKESTRDADAIRGQGTVVLSGDPEDPAMLSLARVKNARALLALTDSDGLNAEIALSTMKILENREGEPLTCVLRISNPGLWKLIREQVLLPGSGKAVRMDFYNGPALGARILTGTYFSPRISTWDSHSSLLIVVGAGRFGENIIVRASREWFEHSRSSSPLNIVVVDLHADTIKDRLISTFPHLKEAANIHAIPVDVLSAGFQTRGFMEEYAPVSHVLAFVCLDDDTAGLTAALALSHHLTNLKGLILVRMDHNPGLARLVGDQETGEMPIIPFHSLSIAARSDLVLGGIREMLARAIHDQYLATLSRIEPVQNETPGVPWDELPERLKESNRLQAEDILEKIRAIGCDIIPMTDWTATTFSFTPDEIEYLAEMEHERWLTTMRNQGFSYADMKDEQKKTHPSMVPYTGLPESEKEKDRDAIRMIPRYLGLIDFQIYRPRRSVFREGTNGVS
ncbi:MAG: Calcium-gated potassium channel MthK [Methanoregulaceae archaeon PtaB.Bin108]|nr:MAG: Calcium-gated potassium channel MthK [Methanoregulaceae archaeon PtaB.Bin108]